MRKHFGCALILARYFLVLTLTVGTYATAEVRVDRSRVQTVLSGGRAYQCFLYRNANRFVLRQSGKLKLGSDAVKALERSLRAKRRLSSPAGRKQLATLKTKVRRGESGCRHPDQGGGSASLAHLNRALTRGDIQYLLDKGALGLSSREESLVQIGLSQGVDALVDAMMANRSEPAGLLARVNDELDGHIGSTTTQTPVGQRSALYDLWLHTNNPYQEKFALFLLSVWTVAGDVIDDETFRSSFWSYYSRLRAYASSNDALPELALALSRDPLMLVYLNNELNVVGNPNENFARELMELFTLGPTDLDGNPNYTETLPNGQGDIAVAAKMLTGWKVNRSYLVNELQPQFLSSRHHTGPHTMFAGTGYAFSGENDEDLIRGIFAHHPGVKNYYAKEILKQYVTPNPSRALIESFGEVIASRGFRLREAMKVLFTSEAFYDQAYRNTVPMNSFEFGVKTARLLELFNGVTLGNVEWQLRKMGIQVNLAPSVFWYNPDTWSSASVVLEKANFVAEIISNNTALQAINWSAARVLPQGTLSPTQLIDAVGAKVGVHNLSAAQRQSLVSYLSTQLQWNGVYVPFTYNNSNPDHQKTKGLGIYYLMFMTPEFNLL